MDEEGGGELCKVNLRQHAYNSNKDNCPSAFGPTNYNFIIIHVKKTSQRTCFVFEYFIWMVVKTTRFVAQWKQNKRFNGMSMVTFLKRFYLFLTKYKSNNFNQLQSPYSILVSICITLISNYMMVFPQRKR